MNAPIDRRATYLGAAFLAVFASSLGAGLLAGSALDGPIAGVLAEVPRDLALVRASNLLQLLTAIGIVPLAALLYVLLEGESRVLALVGFGWWLAEAIMIAVSALGTYGLVTVSAASAGSSASVPDRELLGGLFLGIQQNAFSACMLFFCMGALAFYPLLARVRLVPRWMAAWGLLGAAMLLVATALVAWDRSIDLGLFGIAAMIVYVPFEPVIGAWLLARGAGSRAIEAGELRGIPA
jgi:hypothetical protein